MTADLCWLGVNLFGFNVGDFKKRLNALAAADVTRKRLAYWGFFLCIGSQFLCYQLAPMTMPAVMIGLTCAI